MSRNVEETLRTNPFAHPDARYGYTMTVVAPDRIALVKNFDEDQCRKALALGPEHLQKTVRVAVERRLRQLEKEQRRERLRRRMMNATRFVAAEIQAASPSTEQIAETIVADAQGREAWRQGEGYDESRTLGRRLATEESEDRGNA